jgi:serine/threonine protein kinase
MGQLYLAIGIVTLPFTPSGARHAGISSRLSLGLERRIKKKSPHYLGVFGRKTFSPSFLLLLLTMPPVDNLGGGGDVIVADRALSASDCSVADELSPAALPVASPSSRYVMGDKLHDSLFGHVYKAFDTQRGVDVVIKTSQAKLIKLDGENTTRSKTGITLLEDVRREARVMRLLLGENSSDDEQPQQDSVSTWNSQGSHIIDSRTCGVRADNYAALNRDLATGKRCIAALHHEQENDALHYLVTEFCSGGDLLSVLQTRLHFRVDEDIGRVWFRQLCQSVLYLHAHSVAHSDLSLENACLTESNQVRLIDFGLSSQHPAVPGARTHNRVSPGSYLVNDVKAASHTITCSCKSCTYPVSTMPHQRSLKYLCRPACYRKCIPGKLNYMSPELYARECWDAYANDVWALGVMLYQMLTGHPLYHKPHASDNWFEIVHSGRWLDSNMRTRQFARAYTHLSPSALKLIDSLLKPQHFRPTIDMVLAHPWLQQQA